VTFEKARRIAIAWEDRYWEPLHDVLVRRREAHRPAGTTDNIDFLPFPVLGNGGFGRFITVDWPTAHAKGFPNEPGPIEHVICVADADALHPHVPRMAPPPLLPAAVGAWLAIAEPQFLGHLRAKSHHPATVHAVMLRWAKESLTLAAYDRPQAGDKLGLQIQHPAVQKYLAACARPPGSIPDAEFTDTFRQPVDCIDGALRAQGLSPVGKGSFFDDVIRALSGNDLAVVCARVRDVDRLLRLAWSLVAAPPPALAPAPPPPAPAASQPAKRPLGPKKRAK
jgi:hypothetical protein